MIELNCTTRGAWQLCVVQFHTRGCSTHAPRVVQFSLLTLWNHLREFTNKTSELPPRAPRRRERSLSEEWDRHAAHLCRP